MDEFQKKLSGTAFEETTERISFIETTNSL